MVFELNEGIHEGNNCVQKCYGELKLRSLYRPLSKLDRSFWNELAFLKTIRLKKETCEPHTYYWGIDCSGSTVLIKSEILLTSATEMVYRRKALGCLWFLFVSPYALPTPPSVSSLAITWRSPREEFSRWRLSHREFNSSYRQKKKPRPWSLKLENVRKFTSMSKFFKLLFLVSMIQRLQNLGGLLVQSETSLTCTCMSRFMSRFKAVLTGFKQRKSRIKLVLLLWVTAIYNEI